MVGVLGAGFHKLHWPWREGPLALFVQHTASCYDMSLSCFAFEFFYTTCRGTEVATSFSRVKNVDSVSVPKFKKNQTKIVNFFL